MSQKSSAGGREGLQSSVVCRNIPSQPRLRSVTQSLGSAGGWSRAWRSGFSFPEVTLSLPAWGISLDGHQDIQLQVFLKGGWVGLFWQFGNKAHSWEPVEEKLRIPLGSREAARLGSAWKQELQGGGTGDSLGTAVRRVIGL